MNVLCAGKTLPVFLLSRKLRTVFPNCLLACCLLFSLYRALNCLDWDTCSKVTSIEEFQVLFHLIRLKSVAKNTFIFLYVKSFLRILFETNEIE